MIEWLYQNWAVVLGGLVAVLTGLRILAGIRRDLRDGPPATHQWPEDDGLWPYD